MSSVFTGQNTKKLSAAHRAAIANVFQRHRIAFTKQHDIDWLCDQIELQLSCRKWFADLYRSGIIGAVEMRREIKRLLKTMQSLNPTTLGTLVHCSHMTKIYKDMEHTKYFTRVPKSLADRMQDCPWASPRFFHLAFELVSATCVAALANEPLYKTIGAIDMFAKKKGPPQHAGDRLFIARLARTFQVGTGKRPSDTPEGPFDDLLNAVFNAIAPDRETKPSRKVIREALSTERRS